MIIANERVGGVTTGGCSRSHEYSATYNQGYLNLLKACWILTDIIAIHPQRTHMGASNDRRAYHIQRLTQVGGKKIISS
jgi:hypothetical protein